MTSLFKALFLSFLFLSINPIYAQELNSNLDHIAINNEIVSKKDMNKVDVKYGDTVKIGGIGNPEEVVGITVNDISYQKTIDGNGNWFAMFSILDLENGEYNVELTYGDGRESEILTTIAVQDSTVENQQDDDTLDNPFLGSPLFYILLILSVPLFISLGWYIGTRVQQRNKAENK
jgi:hypothetical protein